MAKEIKNENQQIDMSSKNDEYDILSKNKARGTISYRPFWKWLQRSMGEGSIP